jgi:hypothetical protein
MRLLSPILKIRGFDNREGFRKVVKAEKYSMIKHLVNSETKKIHDIHSCRAVSLGETNFAECLLEGPNSCSYALPFGYCFLCQHPRLSEIVENTKNTGPNKIVRN